MRRSVSWLRGHRDPENARDRCFLSSDQSYYARFWPALVSNPSERLHFPDLMPSRNLCNSRSCILTSRCFPSTFPLLRAIPAPASSQKLPWSSYFAIPHVHSHLCPGHAPLRHSQNATSRDLGMLNCFNVTQTGGSFTNAAMQPTAPQPSTTRNSM